MNHITSWQSNGMTYQRETNGWIVSPVAWDVCQGFRTNGWSYESHYSTYLLTDTYPKGMKYVYLLHPYANPYSQGIPFTDWPLGQYTMHGALFDFTQLQTALFGPPSYLDTNVIAAIPYNYVILTNNTEVDVSADFPDTVPNWYFFSTQAAKMSVPYIEWTSYGQLTEPEYAVCDYLKDPNRIGIGYGDAIWNGQQTNL